MSYDDGRRGRIEEETDRASDGTPPTGLLRSVVARFTRHVREWPSRYVDQQAAVYER
ncbi:MULTISPECIES: hypothetical protein [Halobacterium]|uniref:hypothetical protein n=1 Tax=Halobacterium TaxID=2239 RepID=UPI000B18AF94|nr:MULTISPECIES: hypothetical protein [Halobacterium]MCG1004518.1 hypothetical protein [Halobacterium noricense]